MRSRLRSFQAVVLLLVFPACADSPTQANAGGNDRPHASVLHTASGAEIFRSVVLLAGPLTDSLHETARLAASQPNMSPAVSAVVADFNDRLVQNMQNIDPLFFAQFSTEMHSGNPLRVDSALGAASGLAVRAMRALPEVQQARALREQDPETFNLRVTEAIETLRQAQANAYPDTSGIYQPIDDGRTQALTTALTLILSDPSAGVPSVQSSGFILWSWLVLFVNAAINANYVIAGNIVLFFQVYVGETFWGAPPPSPNVNQSWNESIQFTSLNGDVNINPHLVRDHSNLEREQFVIGLANQLSTVGL